MDAVALGLAKSDTRKQLARPRSRMLPKGATGNPPRVMSSPPTVTLSAAGAASSITNSMLYRPEWRSAFNYVGPTPAYGSAYPQGLYYQQTGVYTTSSNSPWAVEFDVDLLLGKCEFETTGAGQHMRVMVDGQFATAGPSVTIPSDGNLYKVIIDFGAATKRRLRIEGDNKMRFGGLRVGPGDGVTAGPQRLKCVVMGDSYTEPTISDSGTYFAGGGWVQWLGYLTGWNCISAGKGGTGYLNPSTSVKFRDRIAEVTALNPEVLIFAGGINDQAGGYTAAQMQTEVAAILAAAKSALPDTTIIVTSQFWPRGPQSYTGPLIGHKAAIKAAAQAAGAYWIDFLQTTSREVYSSTLAAAASAGATSVSVAAAPTARPDGSYNYWVQIGSGVTADIRTVTGKSGTGPWTLSLGGGALSTAKASGDPITMVGPGFFTGTGRQDAVANDGNADRYTGTDSTHPTGAGHEFLGITAASLITATLPT